MRTVLKYKKILATLFLFAFVSADCFSATVNNVDNTAFITKAEFDSLKSIFQSQMDTYNANIDSKIDTAISSYLAGINIAKTKTKNIILSSWPNYTLLNGSLANDFAYPDLHVNSFYNGVYEVSGRYIMGYATGYLDYVRPQATNGMNLIKGAIFSGSNCTTNNVVWAGRAKNMRETWNISYIFQNTTDFGWGYTSASDNYCRWLSTTSINVNGVFGNSDHLWGGRAVYIAPTATSYAKPAVRVNMGETIPYKNIATSLTYDNGLDGNKFSYEHIGNWAYDTQWEVSEKDISNAAFYSTISANRSDGWLALCTKSGTMTIQENKKDDRDYILKWKDSQFDDRKLKQESTAINTWGSEANWLTENKSKIPTLGLVPTMLKADNILQFSNNEVYDSNSHSISPISLVNGFILCDVKNEDMIEWEPIFSNCTVDGYTDEQEVVVVLSYKPFTNNIATYYEPGSQDKNDYVLIEGCTRGETWPLTNNRKTKIKFKADRDGIVYVKWFPHLSNDDEIYSKHWEATLDIKNCSTYKVTTEQ